MANVSFLNVDMAYGELDEAFPELDAGIRPLGSRVLVQLQRAKNKTRGGIILASESKDTLQHNTQVAKLLEIGPLAFRSRTTGELWPEGQWAEVGAFIRIPKFGGDRWQMPASKDPDDMVTFAMFNDTDIIGVVTCDPRMIRSYV